MMKRRISVIIPVYNGARFIREALESVCNQTYLPVEIVVADDCSTDNTREIVREFVATTPVPITLFTMEKNTGGPYGPASEAFHYTSGDFITVLDADDLFAPEAFEILVGAFDADPDVNVGAVIPDFSTSAHGSGEVLRASSFSRFPDVLGRVIADRSSVGVILEPDEALRAVVGGFAIPFRGLIVRAVWEQLEGFSLQYFHAGDSEFTWRLVSKTNYRVRLVNLPLNRVRSTPGSMSSNGYTESSQLVSLYRDMIKSLNNRELREQVRVRLTRELYDLTYHSYRHREYRDFLAAGCQLLIARLRRKLVLS